MKKSFSLLITALLAVLFVISCGSTGGATGADGVPRPDWVTRPPRQTAETIYFVAESGSARELTKADHARAVGLQQLSQWKDSVTASALERYIRESGEDGNTEAVMHLMSAIVNRAKANTSGFLLEEYWVRANGIYVGLYSYPKQNLLRDAEEAAREATRQAANSATQEATPVLEALRDTLLEGN